MTMSSVPHWLITRQRFGDLFAVGESFSQDQWGDVLSVRPAQFEKSSRDGIVIRPGDSDYFIIGPIDEPNGPVHEACDAAGRRVTWLRRFGRIAQQRDVFINQNPIHLRTPIVLVVDEPSTEPMQFGDAERRAASEQDLDQIRRTSLDRVDIGQASFLTLKIDPPGGGLVWDSHGQMSIWRWRRWIDDKIHAAFGEENLLDFPAQIWPAGSLRHANLFSLRSKAHEKVRDLQAERTVGIHRSKSNVRMRMTIDRGVVDREVDRNWMRSARIEDDPPSNRERFVLRNFELRRERDDHRHCHLRHAGTLGQRCADFSNLNRVERVGENRRVEKRLRHVRRQ